MGRWSPVVLNAMTSSRHSRRTDRMNRSAWAPRRARGREDLFNPHGGGSMRPPGKRVITIPQQISRRLVPRECRGALEWSTPPSGVPSRPREQCDAARGLGSPGRTGDDPSRSAPRRNRFQGKAQVKSRAISTVTISDRGLGSADVEFRRHRTFLEQGVHEWRNSEIVAITLPGAESVRWQRAGRALQRKPAFKFRLFLRREPEERSIRSQKIVEGSTRDIDVRHHLARTIKGGQ